MSNTRNVILELYIFIFDFISRIFGFKNFRIKPSDYPNIEKAIVNYNVREEFIEFCKNIQDGSVIFVDT